MKRNASSTASFVFLMLFGGLFAAVGLGVGIFMLPDALRQGEGEPTVAAGLISVLFTAAGSGLVWLSIRGRRKATTEAERRARYPEQPWLWNDEWASGRIKGDGKAQMVFWWCFAGFWNAISSPLLWKIPQEVERQGLGPSALAALFPLVGFGLLVAAVRATLRWRKFGAAFFEPKTMPGVIGGRLAGVVHLSSVLEPEANMELRLCCINRVTTGSGDSRRTSEHVLWESEQALQRGQLPRGTRGSMIPIEFTIPFDCESTNDDHPNSTIFWRLQISAALPGMDLVKNFIVPVFETPESSADVTRDEEAIPDLLDPEKPSERLPLSRARIERSPAGELSVWLGPARNPGAALMVSVFAAAWTAITALLVDRTDSVVFMLGFGFFSVILCVATLVSWTGTSHITVVPGRLRARRGLLGVGRSRTHLADEIQKIVEEPGSQTGSKIYYRLRLHRATGGATTIAGAIADKAEARNIANAITNALRG